MWFSSGRTSKVEQKSPQRGPDSMALRADRIKGALYGMLIADAFAMPAHWYYGGTRQVHQDYGGPIRTYQKPVTHLAGSIMNKSNTGGAGRGSDRGTIIGDVINHGKRKYWRRGASYHYHVTLNKGDNTLEARLMRRVMDVIGKTKEVNFQALQSEYVRFMTTPNSHNDCYASTAHRMFFKNYTEGKSPDNCPDNDHHNVDTTDAITMTIPVSLFAADDATASRDSARMVTLTRDSKVSSQLAAVFSTVLRSVVRGASVKQAVAQCGATMRYNVDSEVRSAYADPMTA